MGLFDRLGLVRHTTKSKPEVEGPDETEEPEAPPTRWQRRAAERYRRSQLRKHRAARGRAMRAGREVLWDDPEWRTSAGEESLRRYHLLVDTGMEPRKAAKLTKGLR